MSDLNIPLTTPCHLCGEYPTRNLMAAGYWELKCKCGLYMALYSEEGTEEDIVAAWNRESEAGDE